MGWMVRRRWGFANRHVKETFIKGVALDPLPPLLGKNPEER